MKKYLLIITAVILAISCSKTEQGINVSVMGFVNLVDTSGNNVSDAENVKVAIAGTSTSVLTNTYGKYEFTQLEPGTAYSFQFSKYGFGDQSSGSYRFVGPGEPGLVNTQIMYQVPEIKVISDSVRYDNTYQAVFVYVTIAGSYAYKFNAYAKNSPDVSENNYDRTYYGIGVWGLPSNTISYQIPMSSSFYPSGTKVYVALYFYNYYEQGIFDQSKNTTVYTSGHKVGVLEFTL